MKASLLRLLCILTFALSTFLIAARAQEPSPQDLRRVLVRLADAEKDVKGRLINIGPQTLTLRVDGRRLELPLDRVIRIQTAKDPVWNGAVIGGLITGAWCALVCGQGLSGVGQHLPAVLLATGVGAAVGAGIDAANANQVTISSRPAPHVPVVAAPRAALSVSLRF